MTYKFIKLGVFPPQVTKGRKGSGLEFCPKSVDNLNGTQMGLVIHRLEAKLKT